MLILGIETSCDETSAAVVRDGKEILSNIVLSQACIHERFGGVVPEIACRYHVESIMPVIDDALKEALVTLDDIEAICVTHGPGLAGALMVGISAAKGIALAKNIPLVGVNHIEAHIYANLMQSKELKFPFIALVVSGGHTSLFYTIGVGQYEELGKTKDDAAGESYDKIAKLLGLGYPGGPIIDKLAKKGNKNAVKFPRPCLNDGTFDFSFSGLKTAVLYYVNAYKQQHKITDDFVYDTVTCFQEAVVDVLVKKALKAAQEKEVKQIAVGGGVSLNTRLKERFFQEAEKVGIQVFFPEFKLCGDNAAMIAGLAYEKIKQGITSDLDLDVVPNLKIVAS